MLVAFVSRLVPALGLVTALWPLLSLAASPTAPPPNFPTEKEAQEHCAGDLVVWLDLPSKVYYYRGQRVVRLHAKRGLRVPR